MTEKSTMLEIRNLHADIDGKPILKGFTLTINAGEVHAIMGPNGSGKSTLASVLTGRAGYEVTQGEVIYKGQNLLELDVSERAAAGIFLGFQYPVEIPGITSMNFLRSAVNAVREARGDAPLDAVSFLKLAREKANYMEMPEAMLKRAVNVGFSGGEKKRHDIVQMLMLDPSLAILDESDSGLDIDALKVVAKGINAMRGPEKAILMITHYQRLLDYVTPDVVHVMKDGRILRTGGKELAVELETSGYAAYGDAERAAS
jgi:Fe-S cluster assembly ATP-binding protein